MGVALFSPANALRCSPVGAAYYSVGARPYVLVVAQQPAPVRGAYFYAMNYAPLTGASDVCLSKDRGEPLSYNMSSLQDYIVCVAKVLCPCDMTQYKFIRKQKNMDIPSQKKRNFAAAIGLLPPQGSNQKGTG